MQVRKFSKSFESLWTWLGEKDAYDYEHVDDLRKGCCELKQFLEACEFHLRQY